MFEKISQRAKGVIQNLFLLFISIVTVILAADVFFRLIPDLTGIKQGRWRYSTTDPIGKSGACVDCSFRESTLLGYEHIPGSRAGWINSYGLIGREYKLKKEGGVYRILLLGDSTA